MKIDYSKLKVEIETAEELSESLNDPHKTISKTILRSLSFIIENGMHENLNPSKSEDEQEDHQICPKILENTGINKNQLENVFNIEEDDFKVVATINGKNEVERQIKASLIILTAFYYCYGKDEIKSRELVNKLRWLGIKSLGNLSKNLKREECSQFIIISGKGNNINYQILNQGLKKGIEIIKEIATQ